MFRFDIQPMGEFDLFVTGRSHFLLSERSLSFNNAMITLTSARWSARIVELTSGAHIEYLVLCCKEHCAKRDSVSGSLAGSSSKNDTFRDQILDF